MENEKPFIQLFKTPYAHYVFDVNINDIYMVDGDLYNALLKIRNGTYKSMEEVDEDIRRKISKMKQEGLLSSKRPKQIKHPVSDHLEYRLNNKVAKITLQVTQGCNFRCSYCVYAEDHSSQRNHTNKAMSFDTAKKGIDFLISHSRDCETVNIGFYGGEPLLEFDLIKRTVEYAEKAAEGKEVTFAVTTNGSLLSDEIIEFFIKYKFIVTISLDGPKEINDRNRRFAANGCGTFEAVHKNLERVKDKYPEFSKKISYSVVIDPRNDYSCFNSLFVDYEFFNQANTRPTLIDDTYSNEKIYYTESYLEDRNYEIFKAYLCYFNRMDKKYISPIAFWDVNGNNRLKLTLGGMREISDITAHSGPCVPGERRLFVNVDGYLYPCERVSETSEVMKIGHIDDGFDLEKAHNLLDIGKLTESSCKNCWSITLCSLCAKYADNVKELSADYKRSYCNGVKRQNEYRIRDYLLLNDINTFWSDYISANANSVNTVRGENVNE